MKTLGFGVCIIAVGDAGLIRDDHDERTTVVDALDGLDRARGPA